MQDSKDSKDSKESKESKESKDTNLKETIKSIGAAFIGVQSKKNYERDFSQRDYRHFIIAGVLGVAVFIGTLVAVVLWVLP